MKYSYSDNEELFSGHCDTLESAIAEALDDYPDAETIYVGECTQKTIGGYLHLNHIETLLESLTESAYKECGEVVEDWLLGSHIQMKSGESRENYNVRREAWRKERADRLEFLLDGFRVVLEAWATDRGEQPRFWHVGNVKFFSREEAEAITGNVAESI